MAKKKSEAAQKSALEKELGRPILAYEDWRNCFIRIGDDLYDPDETARGIFMLRRIRQDAFTSEPEPEAEPEPSDEDASRPEAEPEPEPEV